MTSKALVAAALYLFYWLCCVLGRERIGKTSPVCARTPTLYIGGKIAQSGTHEALMRQGGLYRRFVQSRELTVGWKV